MQPGNDLERDYATRAVVPGNCIRLTGEAARVLIPGQHSSEEPRIELVRTEGVIQAIDITCGCGRRYRLRCVYEE